MSMPAALGACAGVLLLYNIYALSMRAAGGYVLMLHANALWAAKHAGMRGAADVTLAVQTLRNTVLVATFVGTLSFTTAFSVLRSVTPENTDSDTALALLDSGLLFCAFLNYAFVIRCAAHEGYLIGGTTAPLPPPLLEQPRPAGGSGGGGLVSSDVAVVVAAAASPPAAPPELIALGKMRALHFSLGFRCLYCAIPFIFGVAGVWPLVVATIVILLWLVYIDAAVTLWSPRLAPPTGARRLLAE